MSAANERVDDVCARGLLGGLCDSVVNPAVSLCHADNMYVPHAEGTECSRTCISGSCTTRSSYLGQGNFGTPGFPFLCIKIAV